MKYVKLILIFLLVAGGLWFVLNWGSLFSPEKKEKGFGKKDEINVDGLRQEMKNEWKGAEEWNADLYVDWFQNIEQKKGGRLITEKSYNMLRTTLRLCAIDKLSNSFSASLLPANYSEARVKTMRDGVDTIVEYEEITDINNQPSLQHIQDVYSLYTEINKFVQSKHKITSSFNADNLSWKSFADKQKDINSTARAYRNNPLYANLENVPGFADGLNEIKLTSMTEKEYRKPFYDNLSSQIIQHFEYIVPVKDTASVLNKMTIRTNGSNVVVNLDKLNETRQRQLGMVWTQFDKEDNGEGYKELTRFKIRFGKALDAVNAQRERELQNDNQ